MSNLLALLAIIGVPLVIGVVPALLAFVPPIRRAARNNSIIRVAVMLTCGLIAGIVMYGLMVRVGNEISMIFYNIQMGSSLNLNAEQFEERETIPALYETAREELWIRHMMPFPTEGTCYTTPAECEAADKVEIAVWSNSQRHSYDLSSVLVLLIPAAISAGTVWFITRKPQNSKMRLGYQSIHKELDIYA